MNDFNVIKLANRLYKYESFWQDATDNIVDYNNKPFPMVTDRINDKWYMKGLFIDKLKKVELYLISGKKFIKYNSSKEYKKCLLCEGKDKDKIVATGLFNVNNVRWENSLLHYIINHNVKPTDPFIDMIFRLDNNPYVIATKKIKGTTVVKHNRIYLKLHKNQIHIMDALMEHGSSRIYYHNKDNSLKYSEHAGLLDFNVNGLEKVLVYANTNIVSKGDDEIFFPNTLTDAFDYEYIFHTHPATHSHGGRAQFGILYEFQVSTIFFILWIITTRAKHKDQL